MKECRTLADDKIQKIHHTNLNYNKEILTNVEVKYNQKFTKPVELKDNQELTSGLTKFKI